MTNERAIEHIRGIKSYLTTGNPMWNTDVIEEACGMAIEALEEPERKQGKWIVDEDGMIHCSACANIPTNRIMDAVQVLYDIHPLLMNYCPNCGAKMEMESE